MQSTQLKKARNRSLECCKLVAAIFVVFIHAEFPGDLGSVINCLARFAVPMFFAISGYFNYQADSAKIGRRMMHILKLNLIAIAAYLLWGCLLTKYYGGSAVLYLTEAIPDREKIVRWVFLHINPFAGHLWYLTAIGVCYLIFWIYVRCRGENKANYSALYFACFWLLAVYFAFDTLEPMVGPYVPCEYYRNGWFLGLPMFTMGIFLHEYQEQIFAKLHLSAAKLVLLILAGAALSVLQWKKIRSSETPVGAYFEVVALMLLLTSHPEVPVSSGLVQNGIARFGFLSTAIYILHVLFIEFYEIFIQEKLAAVMGEMEPYLKPILVVVLSLAAGGLCLCVQCLLKRAKSKLE